MGRCECQDKGCTGGHYGSPDCHSLAVESLVRIDMVDSTPVGFCGPCSEDAMGSGVFDLAEEVS